MTTDIHTHFDDRTDRRPALLAAGSSLALSGVVLAAGLAGSQTLLVSGCAAAFLGLAVATDVYENRIPNWLTLPGLALALVLAPALGGAGGLVAALLGAALGLAIGVGPYALGGMGAGDVKAMMVLGAWLGASSFASAAVFAVAAGAVLAIVALLARAELSDYLRRWARNLWLSVAGPSHALRAAHARLPRGPRHPVRRGAGDRRGPALCNGRCVVKRTDRRSVRRRQRRSAGTSTVEMAIVLPLLIMVCFGISEFGLAYTQWQTLTNATREGARAAVVFRTPCNAGAVQAEAQTVVDTFAAAAGIPAGSIATVVAGACAGTGNPLTVSTTLPYDYFALSALAGLGPTTNLRARTVMRNE